MIYFITRFLKAFIFLNLLNSYLKNEYPQYYNGYLMTLTFNGVYLFSVLQIQAKKFREYICKTYPRLKSYLDEYNRSINENKNNIEFILDGKVIYLTDKEKIANHIVNITKEDFIIYSDYDTVNSNNVCVNKKIIIKDSISSNNDFIYEVSNIKFLLCEVYVGDKVYKIDLKSDIENYYLIDNIINKKFIIYYLIKFYNEDFSKSTDKFIFKFIDHNVNSCEIDMTTDSNIQFKKNEYIKNHYNEPKTFENIDNNDQFIFRFIENNENNENNGHR